MLLRNFRLKGCDCYDDDAIRNVSDLQVGSPIIKATLVHSSLDDIFSIKERGTEPFRMQISKDSHVKHLSLVCRS